MILQTLMILVIFGIITVSGLYINFFRENKETTLIVKPKESSLLIFRLLIPIGILLSMSIYFSKITSYSFSAYLFYLGTIVSFLGLFIRWIAVYTLSKSFRVNICIVEGQELKKDGVYSFVRHPSYTGFLMYYLGVGLIMHNVLGLLILLIVSWVTVLYRLKKEENLLLSHFNGTYEAYKKETKKLIPFIY